MIWNQTKHRRYAQIADYITSLGIYYLAFLISGWLHKYNEEIFPPIIEISNIDIFFAFFFPFLTVMIFHYQKAYNYQRFTSLSREFIIIIKVVNVNIVLNILTIFLLKLSETPRTLFIVYYVLAIIIFMTEKISLFYLASYIRKKGGNRKRILLVGTGNRTSNFIKTVNKNFGWGLDIIGILSSDEKLVGKKIDEIPIIGNYSDMNNILRKYNPEEVIITISTKKFEDITRIVNACQLQGVQVRLNSDFFGKVTENLKIDNIYGLNIVSFNISQQDELKLVIKRTIDFIV